MHNLFYSKINHVTKMRKGKIERGIEAIDCVIHFLKFVLSPSLPISENRTVGSVRQSHQNMWWFCLVDWKVLTPKKDHTLWIPLV